MASINAAAIRAADSLLRTIGGRQVLLRTPPPANPNDNSEQLGLAVPSFQDLALSPVVFRRVRPKLASSSSSAVGNSTEYELLVSATAINALISTVSYDSAETLFAAAQGILLPDASAQGVLLRIESATWSEIGGAPYLYRLLLRAPLAIAC